MKRLFKFRAHTGPRFTKADQFYFATFAGFLIGAWFLR